MTKLGNVGTLLDDENNPPMMKFRCKIGFHKWSIWKTTETKNIEVYLYDDSSHPYRYERKTFQEKKCLCCDLKKFKVTQIEY